LSDVTLEPAVTARYSAKREAIIAAATEILNRRGVRGMTLADVAERVGLITTSVTYYFKRKDELAAACFASGIERLGALVHQARAEPTPADRIRRLLQLYLELRARIVAGEAPPIPVFSDIRALAPEVHGATAVAYANLFRRIRGLFAGPGGEALSRGAATARTEILMEQIHWAEAWLPRYEATDYPRVGERMFDILEGGLGRPGAVWRTEPLAIGGEGAPAAGREAFLLAATRLINQRGYRGASVELISAQLNVTKGSFYHHHSAKDDVVSACFERSFGVVRRAQLAAQGLAGDQWLKLASAAAALVEFQFSPAGPLLRTSALAALPEGLREAMIEESRRLSDRFAAMIAAGVAEGSLRPVDPFIAAQMLGATLNAAADLPFLLRGVDASVAAQLYARPFFTGLTAR
jgi:AcrR family transcriptional regulator